MGAESLIVAASLVAALLMAWSAEGAICGWDSNWYNTDVPSAANNFTDTEILPFNAAGLESVCDSSAGGMLKIRCKHAKGVPFQIFHNDTVEHFTVTCMAVTGLHCYPWTSYGNSSCPDFSLQLGCECKTTKQPVTTSFQSGTKSMTTSSKIDGGFSTVANGVSVSSPFTSSPLSPGDSAKSTIVNHKGMSSTRLVTQSTKRNISTAKNTGGATTTTSNHSGHTQDQNNGNNLHNGSHGFQGHVWQNVWRWSFFIILCTVY